MKAQAALDVLCKDLGTSRALYSVLAPDNEGGPRGLRVSMSSTGRRLRIEVESKTPATALSTCLAFLRDIALFQEVSLLSRQRQG